MAEKDAIIEVELTGDEAVNVAFAEDDCIEVDFGGSALDYLGPYEVTPSAEEQELNTANRVLAENVKVAAIPNNYGLITTDGVVITVS